MKATGLSHFCYSYDRYDYSFDFEYLALVNEMHINELLFCSQGCRKSITFGLLEFIHCLNYDDEAVVWSGFQANLKLGPL